MSYLITVAQLIMIYAIVSVSLSLLIGHTGVFSMAHAALFGVGAYTAGVLTVTYHVGFVPALLAAAGLAAIVSAVMAAPSLRVSGDYFIVASLAIQVMVVDVITNWGSVTGGPSGLPGVSRPVIAGVEFSSDGRFLGLVTAVAAVVIAICMVVVRSPFGRTMHAVRDDELAAATLGKATRRTKIVVAIFSGGIAGLAGVFYGQYLLFVSPDSFTLTTSITIVTMVVIGGMNSILGSALGAAVIIMLPEALKQLALPQSAASALQQMIFGALLIVLMFLRPQGLVGGRLPALGVPLLRSRVRFPGEAESEGTTC